MSEAAGDDLGLTLQTDFVPKALMALFDSSYHASDTVELQKYFRVADGYFAADCTSFRGCKIS